MGKVVGERNLPSFQRFGDVLATRFKFVGPNKTMTLTFEHIPMRSKIVEFRHGRRKPKRSANLTHWDC